MAQVALPSTYILKRDQLASTRLNYLHFLLTQQLGSLLHPNIKIAERTGDVRVADVGGGTSIWATSLLQQYPWMKATTFDISADQFPPREYLASNLSLCVHDAFEPFPPEYLDTFDVVHLRLMVSLVKDNPRPLLENLKTLLKPGGWIQWTDIDPESARVVSPREGVKKVATEQIARFLQRPEYNYVAALDDHMRTVGFENVVLQLAKTRPEQYSLRGQGSLLSIEEVVSNMEMHGTDGGEKMRKIFDAMKEEAAEGIFWITDIVAAVGQKPK